MSEIADAARRVQRASEEAQERRADLVQREAELDMHLSGDEWEYGWRHPASGVVITDEARGHRLLGWPKVRRRVGEWQDAP